VVKLYLDTDVDPLVARQLQARGHDVVSAYEVGMAAAADPAHLAYATRKRRALLTFNIGHFATLYEQWWHEGRTHWGVLVSRQYQRAEIGDLLWLVENVLTLATEEDLANRLRYLSEFDV
jgi:hypothetical protein